LLPNPGCHRTVTQILANRCNWQGKYERERRKRVEANFDRCFQLMECHDLQLLQQGATHWQDLVEFEFVPVLRSKEAVEIITPGL
jgi:hypothetical protein